MYGAFKLQTKMLFMENSTLNIQGGEDAYVGTSDLEASSVASLRVCTLVSSPLSFILLQLCVTCQWYKCLDSFLKEGRKKEKKRKEKIKSHLRRGFGGAYQSRSSFGCSFGSHDD